MPIQKALFNIKGMTRDNAASKFSPEFAFENKNLRVLATDNNTSFGLVNERGTATTGIMVDGTPIGQEVINDKLILFTTGGNGGGEVLTINAEVGVEATLPEGSGSPTIPFATGSGDTIYKFSLDGGSLSGDILYSGDLNFDVSSPIESIGVYENEEIQKVYWVDGRNQPRVINVEGDNSHWNNNTFNFVKQVKYNGGISITKNQISFGSFAPGTIQYFFTYFDLYGSETNIFYSSPLYYTSPSNRGGAPDETVSCSFTIKIELYDTRFEYLRIYSVLRTSVDATPQVRKVVDISIKSATSDILYTDTGIGGESLAPTDLLFVGGEPIIAGTLSQKDNTLFLGDITVDRLPISTSVKDAARNLSPATVGKTILLPDDADVGNYSYTSQLNKSNAQITYFRRGETYRLGFQAQHSTGKWSDVIFIKDFEVNTRIVSDPSSPGSVLVNNIKANLTNAIVTDLVSNGYVKVRPVVVLPDGNDRTIICEGVCCPTVYNVEDRYTNSPYAQASWFFRPNGVDNAALSAAPQGKFGKYAEFRHNYPIPANKEVNSEIQCISNAPPFPTLGVDNNGFTESGNRETWVSQNRECYYIDQSIFTLHSPDIELDDSLKTLDSTQLAFRIVGYVPIHANYCDVDIEASTPASYANGKDNDAYQYKAAVAPGFVKNQVTTTTANPEYGWRSLLSGPLWLDDFSDSIDKNRYGNYPVGFIVYPWHKSGSMNGAKGDNTNSVLQHKKMSIFRYSRNSYMLPTRWSSSITGVVKFDSDEISMVKIPGQASTSGTYYGNIDKVLIGHSKPKGKFVLRDYDPSAIYDQNISSEGDVANLPAAYPITIVYNGLGALGQTFLSNPESYSDVDSERVLFNTRLATNYSRLFNNSYRYLDSLQEVTYEGRTAYMYGRYIFQDSSTVSTDPVSIKYKSTPHLVVAFANSGDNQVILPKNTGGATTITNYSNKQVFWGSTTGAIQEVITETTDMGSEGFLWLGEIYRTDITNDTRFGGTSNEALENNKWIPGGEPIDIVNANGEALSGSSCTLVWSQGDTYYQRYDCLKTYPFTMEDTNSVSDTLSFMCETRVNIDGRYDKNRGQLSNLYAHPSNVNLINKAYSQQNNYLVYRGLNPNKINSVYFPNSITWSKSKTNGEIVDTWTNITLASTLDMDGDKGKIRALRRFNNDILSFQDRGISQILYNDAVQIATTTGVPIEIANSGKVSGKRYISNHIGCYNKWSICSAPTGIYFMDDVGKDIYLFNGQLNNLSDKLGFHSWVVQNFPNMNIWNPRDFDTQGEITYYDKINGDVLFITGGACLAYSEFLGGFTSFYSYEKTPYFATVKDRGVLWHKDDSLQSGDTGFNKYKAWMYQEGPYNYFFNVYQPFYTTIVANEHPVADKIFDNLEYRGDTFTPGGEYLHNNTFDKLETWDEYQRGIAYLTNVKDWGYTTSNLKKKFRIWRAVIPRNTEGSSFKRDRMRNPWLYLKLSKETPNSNKTILHDLVVHYFE